MKDQSLVLILLLLAALFVVSCGAASAGSLDMGDVFEADVVFSVEGMGRANGVL